VWSALTGALSKTFQKAAESRITAVSVDLLQKRLLIGEEEGRLTILNIFNGAVVCTCPGHAGMVISAVNVYSEERETCYVISGGYDNSVNISIDKF
jgi:hypothetical protein